MRVTKRINEILDFAKDGKRYCDIGCDHGNIGILLIEKFNASYVIFSDILRAPLSNAIFNVTKHNISHNKVDFRVGDGLCVIGTAEVDTVIITGLGGKTIVDILKADLDKTYSFSKFVLQPTNSEEMLRQWFCDHGFVIERESLIEDGGVYYETFLISKGNEVLSDNEIQFGKYIDYTDKVFIRKYKGVLASLENTRKKIPKNCTDIIADFDDKIEKIKGVLNEGR